MTNTQADTPTPELPPYIETLRQDLARHDLANVHACINLKTAMVDAEALRRLIAASPPAQPQTDEARDAARLDWLDENADQIFKLGISWYHRDGYGCPVRKVSTLRAAIDAQIAQIKQEPK